MIIKIKTQKPKNPFGKFSRDTIRRGKKHEISKRRQEKENRKWNW